MDNFELGSEVDRLKREMQELRKDMQVLETSVDNANAAIGALEGELFSVNEAVNNIFEAISWPDIDDYTEWNLIRGSIPRTIFSLRIARNMSKESFGWTMMTKGKVRIYTGSLRIGGKGTYTLAQEDVTLTGNPEYIYLQWTRAAAVLSLEHAATEPASDGTTMKLPLYQFARASDGSGRYILTHDYRNDVNMDVVTR